MAQPVVTARRADADRNFFMSITWQSVVEAALFGTASASAHVLAPSDDVVPGGRPDSVDLAARRLLALTMVRDKRGQPFFRS